MVGLFAGLCASEGHNRAKVGKKYQTFDGKMAAVAFAHKAVRNARLDYRDPEFELIAQGYKRTNNQVDRKQPVTTPMLRQMKELVNLTEPQDRLLWGSMVLGFFFLDRSSELWGPVTIDKSVGTNRIHCVKARKVILRDKHGKQVRPEATSAHSVEVLFGSHKGDRIGQGAAIRHYRTSDSALCPVKAAQACLTVRGRWLAKKVALGPYLTSISRKETIKKTKGRKSHQDSGVEYGTAPEGVLLSLAPYRRRLRAMVRDAASSMTKASTWERHEPSLMQLEGESASLTQANQAYLPHSQ